MLRLRRSELCGTDASAEAAHPWAPVSTRGLPSAPAAVPPLEPATHAARPKPPRGGAVRGGVGGGAVRRGLGRGPCTAGAGPWRGGARASGARRAAGPDAGGSVRGGCCARYLGRCLRRRRSALRLPGASARCGLVMETQPRPFQLVVLGASGFTGQFVTEEVAREQVSPGRSSRLPWAVAGRCREKLQRVLERAALRLGKGAGGTAPGPSPRAAVLPRRHPSPADGGRREGASERVKAFFYPLNLRKLLKLVSALLNFSFGLGGSHWRDSQGVHSAFPLLSHSRAGVAGGAGGFLIFDRKIDKTGL